jgi:hypothetical protein
LYTCIFYKVLEDGERVIVNTPTTIKHIPVIAYFVISSFKNKYDKMSVNNGHVKTSAETI